MMDQNVVYLVYIALSVLLVLGTGWQLFKYGAVFLKDVFAQEPELAGAVNRLLLMGFYLVSLGFILLTATSSTHGPDGAPSGDAFRILTLKLGGVAMLLGVVHFVNLLVLNSARHRRIDRRAGWNAPTPGWGATPQPYPHTGPQQP
jgi:hypothetical protein